MRGEARRGDDDSTDSFLPANPESQPIRRPVVPLYRHSLRLTGVPGLESAEGRGEGTGELGGPAGSAKKDRRAGVTTGGSDRDMVIRYALEAGFGQKSSGPESDSCSELVEKP